MLKIAICDDDQTQLDELCAMLEAYSNRYATVEMQISRFSCAEALEQHRQARGGFTLLILDVLMPGCTGIEYARALRASGGAESIIFVTSSQDFALDAFSVEALQYIVKPISQEVLFAALDRVLAQQGSMEAKSVTVPLQSGVQRVHYHSIVYIECSYHQVFYYLTDGSCIKSRTIRQSFAEYITAILADERFIRTHYSFVVNKQHVARMEQHSFQMYGGHTVPIAKERLAKVKKSYFSFIDQTGEEM